MNESEVLSYNLLFSVLNQIPTAKPLISPQMTKAEMLEILRLHSSAIYQTYQDVSIAYDSLNFIASDYQLRMKAEDIWKQQLEVFRDRIRLLAEDLILACKAENIFISDIIEKIINY